MHSLNQNTITVSKNDTYILELEVTLDYTAADLSACTNRLIVKENVSDADADAVINITNDITATPTAGVDITTGLIYFKFTPSHTVNLVSKKYFYDITITDASNNKFTIRRGDFYIIGNIYNP